MFSPKRVYSFEKQIIGVVQISVSYTTLVPWVERRISFRVSSKVSSVFSFSCLGGHRIWQGCIDLLNYLEENPLPVSASTVVVELGCGHGLPGCYMLRKGARVYFQDYNEDSLEKATLPTIVVNCGVDAVNRYTFNSSFPLEPNSFARIGVRRQA